MCYKEIRGQKGIPLNILAILMHFSQYIPLALIDVYEIKSGYYTAIK